MGKHNNEKLRKAIAVEAARLKYEGLEKEYFTAKRKAARHYGVNQPQDLPSNREIKDEILRMAAIFEGEERFLRLGEMRGIALRVMKILHNYHPKLIGSVLKSHIRKNSDIDIHVFSNSIAAVTMLLAENQLDYDVERKEIIKNNERQEFIHVRAEIDGYDVEMSLYPEDKKKFPFKSSITGDTMEFATIPELEALILENHPEIEYEI